MVRSVRQQWREGVAAIRNENRHRAADIGRGGGLVPLGGANDGLKCAEVLGRTWRSAEFSAAPGKACQANQADTEQR